MAEEGLGGDSFTQTLAELKEMMDSLNSTYKDVMAGLKKSAVSTDKPARKPAVKKAARKTVKRPRRE